MSNNIKSVAETGPVRRSVEYLRKMLYFNSHRYLVGSELGGAYRRIYTSDQIGISGNVSADLLVDMLKHCQEHVPYYRELLARSGTPYTVDPQAFLSHFPVLTKDTIRQNFNRLLSDDLDSRNWAYNSSGGSTGEPIRLIQDRQFTDYQMAIQWLSFTWAGRSLGEPGVHLWGSERDILQQTIGLKKKILNRLTNDRYFNAFLMTPEKMRKYLQFLNVHPPKLIIAYVQSIYELAQFAISEHIAVTPQQAIMTSAGTLYPFMREKIEAVFHCKIFNRYGSREVGDIACECSAHAGLHVFPWGNYIEIVDDQGNPVPDGVEGNILVTNLNNFAMPLIRYAIGERGMLSLSNQCTCGRHGQILERLSGRNVDVFRKRDGTIVDGEYFTHLLYFKDWVQKFQVVQKDYSSVLYKIQKTAYDYQPWELEEIQLKTRIVMGEDCKVTFEFLNEIPPSSSGKYSYTITEVGQDRLK
jgi:phenylacetate-CoA ligase